MSGYLGVPDASFPFPFAQLNGVRLAVPVVDPALVKKTTEHFRAVLSDTFENDLSHVNEYAAHGYSIYHKPLGEGDVRRVTSLEALEALHRLPPALSITPPRKYNTTNGAGGGVKSFSLSQDDESNAVEGVELMLMRSADEIPEDQEEGEQSRPESVVGVEV